MIFLKTSKSNELEENGFRIEEFQKYFFYTIFHHHFRPKIVFLGTDSILRVKTMYDSVK